ncbi:MAG: endonuclease mitochondrial [Burkholderiales bacterium]
MRSPIEPFMEKHFALRLGALFFGMLFSALSIAQQTDCPKHFAGGAAPEFISEKLAHNTVELCFEAYAVMHSGVSRTPLWSAEHLNRARISDAKAMKRRNAFHPEEQLPPNERAELRDYARSGFDRGHMSPSGDMPDESAQYESFSLANIIPQDPNNNQRLWADIEEQTRYLAAHRGELYVITGPMFEGESLRRINGRVLVPTHVFKAVYDPIRKQAGAYIAPNTEGAEYETVPIAELERRINIDLFPGLPSEVKQRKMNLPTPSVRQRRPGPHKENDADGKAQDVVRRILRTFGIRP